MKRSTPEAIAGHLATTLDTLAQLRGEARVIAGSLRTFRALTATLTTALGRKGTALAERAYDDDGELLNPATEAAVTALADGLPDFTDDLDQALDAMRALDARLADTRAELAAIVVPTEGAIEPAARCDAGAEVVA